MEDDRNGDDLVPTSLNAVFEHAELKGRITDFDNLTSIFLNGTNQKYRANMNYIDLAGCVF